MSFALRSALTQRFTLGAPRSFSVSVGGERVAFARSRGETDPVNCLWVIDCASEEERLVADPAEILAGLAGADGAGGADGDVDGADAALPEAEKARRERAREAAGGIVAYSCDDSLRHFAFALSGLLFVAHCDEDVAAASAPAEADRMGVEVLHIDIATAVAKGGAAGVTAGVFDPRISPDARHVSFVVGDALWVAPTDGSAPARQLVGPSPAADGPVADGPVAGGPAVGRTVSWGSAEFIAAEEMGRSRGHWWSPDGTALAVARVDVAGVKQWHIADPSNPAASQRTIRYPAAGTENADVQLFVIPVPVEAQPNRLPQRVRWDGERFPYLCDVSWGKADEGSGLTLVIQSRDQKELQVLAVELAAAGESQTPDIAALGELETQLVASQSDPNWVELVRGAPLRTPHGVISVGEFGGARSVALIGEPITEAQHWVREVLRVDWGKEGTASKGISGEAEEMSVWYLASLTPADVVLYRLELLEQPDGTFAPLASKPMSQPSGAVASALVRGGTAVISQATLAAATTTRIHASRALAGASPRASAASGAAANGVAPIEITSFAADPFEALAQESEVGNVAGPNLELARAGDNQVPLAIIWPQGFDPNADSNQATNSDQPRLPILLDPYGGPHVQRVLSARAAYATSQWFANQGFCVVVADGRGTPGRGGGWEQSVSSDLATLALQDQLAALDYVLQYHPTCTDASSVAMRGWSFGGFLAALAVLRRPDRIHAAIAGAPVTGWSLYDTHYTERYLGDPADNAAAYRVSSLIQNEAGEPRLVDDPLVKRPIMLIHGLADDNVVAAHSLRLSSALLAAGHPHEFLPLSGVTHMTPQPSVAENLLGAQIDFLNRTLGALN